MRKSREISLRRLDESIERWKNIEEAPWKEWAFGYLLCLQSQMIIDYMEFDDICKERGITK